MKQDDVIRLHETHQGVLEMTAELKVRNNLDLSKAYTPGVAEVSTVIKQHPELKRELTLSGKLVAVITDGSAVLGLGNVGPAQGLPIVEGKALLYKELADVDAIPIAIDQVSTQSIVQTIKNIALSFAGIHLEDIAAPRCFEIETALKQQLSIPVYHDDQEGTAIVVLAALINASRVVGKSLTDLRVIINGVGAAGVATANLLIAAGLKHLILVDRAGVITPTSKNANDYQRELAKRTISNVDSGNCLDQVINDQDVFIGLSEADVLSGEHVRKMADKPIIFALANPQPEINPTVATQAGAAIVATGSSQYPNQVNNILVFPGLFQGLIQSRLTEVSPQLELLIASMLAKMVKRPTVTKIIPGVFDDGVVQVVANAVVKYTRDSES